MSLSLDAQATHALLSEEVDRSQEPSPYAHTVHEARARAQIVSMRAALMSSHLGAMLAASERGGANEVG